MSDASDEVREKLAASTRPKAVIHWLDNDSALSGEYRGMVLDMEASWPEYTILFRHCKGFSITPIFAYPATGSDFSPWPMTATATASSSPGPGMAGAVQRVEAPDSLATEYLRFQQQVDSISTCRENSCKQAKAAALEAWSAGLEARALENGFPRGPAQGRSRGLVPG